MEPFSVSEDGTVIIFRDDDKDLRFGGKLIAQYNSGGPDTLAKTIFTLFEANSGKYVLVKSQVNPSFTPENEVIVAANAVTLFSKVRNHENGIFRWGGKECIRMAASNDPQLAAVVFEDL